jgi:hypothetical protein
MSNDSKQLSPEQLATLDALSAAVREKPAEPGFLGFVASAAHAVAHAATSAAHAVANAATYAIHASQTQTVQSFIGEVTQDLANAGADALDTAGGGEGEGAEKLGALGQKLDDRDDLSLNELKQIRNEHIR